LNPILQNIERVNNFWVVARVRDPYSPSGISPYFSHTSQFSIK
jgi:hypothetical protein